MGMSIDDMSTSNLNLALSAGVSMGFKSQLGTWAGVGGGASLDIELADTVYNLVANANVGVQTDRISSSHYEYTFTFAYDFSTSSDPNLAGHPSDVIIGGGLDLIVSEAIKGELLRDILCLESLLTFIAHCLVFINTTSSPAGYKCFTSQFTYQWQPGRVTTYALPVYEIEELIGKLSIMAIRDSANRKDILAQVNNWKTVLADYREHTNTADVFTVEDAQLLYFVNKFHIVENNFHPYIPVRRRELGINPETPFYTIMDKFESKCKTSVMNICREFSASKWQNVGSFLTGYCGQANMVMDNEYLMDSVCRTGKRTNPSFIKGDVNGEDSNSLFGFLKDSSKLLTFGANAPVSLSWTSSVGDDVALSDINTISTEAGVSVDASIGIKAASALLATELMAGKTISLGHNYDSGQALERTVTINLDDSDYGELGVYIILAIRQKVSSFFIFVL
jgi:hypothetical protein